MSGGRRGHGRRGGGHEEEHENHERWLVSYADMVTLLMVLFIVLFAISQVDQKKFAALKDGLASGFGSELNVVTVGGVGITPDAGKVPTPLDLAGNVGPGTPKPTAEDVREAVRAAERARAEDDVAAAREELADLEHVREDLSSALAGRGLQDAVRFDVTERGLDVVLVADELFFAGSSAELRPGGREVLQTVGPILADLPMDLSVEGHANHLPVGRGAYPSNWELSAARAGSVVRHLVTAEGIEAARLSATGYSDTRPLVPRSDPRAVEVNRRVDLLVLSDAPPRVRALLPTLADAG